MSSSVWLLLLQFFLLVLAHPNHAKSEDDEKTRRNEDIAYMREKMAEIGKKSEAQIKKQEEKWSQGDRNVIEDVVKDEKKRERKMVLETGDGVASINEKAGVADGLYGGDIILTRNQTDFILSSAGEENDTENEAAEGGSEGGRARRQAFRDTRYPTTIWSSGFYYYFDSTTKGTHAETVARKAIKKWHDNTCINFYESSTASQKVMITKGSGCWSYIGRTGYATQSLSLGTGCDSVGTALHEIGHALGYYHEQGRHDRDYYVYIQSANIKSGQESQFNKQTTATNYNYGWTYDYGGIMQYPGTAFSSNGSPTVVARDFQQQSTMGSDILSFRDILEMNDHYGCRSRCNGYTTTCYHGGYMHPRNCNICLCPLGFGGANCGQRPAGCGQNFYATTSGGSFSGTIGDTSTTVYDDFSYCIYWIIVSAFTSQGDKFEKAPAGMRVKATLSIFKTSHCVSGCTYGGIELKRQPTLTGPRFCCNSDAGRIVYSNSNFMPIIVYRRYNYIQYGITYVAF